MKEWRPEGFENPYTPDLEQTEEYLDHGARDQSIFEDGADAMLTVLRKQDIREFGTLVGWIDGKPSGTLVYIPDGKSG